MANPLCLLLLCTLIFVATAAATTANLTSHSVNSTAAATTPNLTSHSVNSTAAANNTIHSNATTATNRTSLPNATSTSTSHPHAKRKTISNTTAPLILDLCNHTRFFSLYAKSLSQEHSSHNADAHGLAAISLRLASLSAHTTATYIAGLGDGSGDDSNLQQYLADCAESHSDAVDQLDDSTAAFDKRSFTDVNTWVSAAMTDTAACKDSYSAVDKKKSVDLLKRNEHFNRMCSILLSLTSALPK